MQTHTQVFERKVFTINRNRIQIILQQTANTTNMQYIKLNKKKNLPKHK